MTVMLKAALMIVGAVGVHSMANTGPTPAAPRPVTVRQVLTRPVLIGATVRVTGRCLGQDDPAVRPSTRPLSGEVWQIEDRGFAAWVIGPRPEACASGTASITAQVAQDTLPKLGPMRFVRQYLVLR